MVYIWHLHPLQMLKSCDRTMCWLGKVCAGFQVYGKQYSVQRCTGSFSEVQTWQWVGIHFASLQKFSKPTSACKPIIFYMVNRRRNGHTLALLQKRQQLYHYHAPLWSARSRSCSVSHTVGLTFHTWTESPVYSCFQGRCLCFSCCNYSFPNSSYS